MGHFERLARRGGGGGSPHRSNDAAADHAEAMGAAVDESAMRPSSRLSERCLGALELIGGTTWREELVLGMVEPSRSSPQEATRGGWYLDVDGRCDSAFNFDVKAGVLVM